MRSAKPGECGATRRCRYQELAAEPGSVETVRQYWIPGFEPLPGVRKQGSELGLPAVLAAAARLGLNSKLLSIKNGLQSKPPFPASRLLDVRRTSLMKWSAGGRD